MAHLIHIGGDAPGHPPQELLCLRHGLLLQFPLFHQRLDDGALFRGIQVDDHALRFRLFSSAEVPGIGSAVPVKCFGDGGGDEEHSVQIRSGFAQRFACDKVPCDCSVIFVPLQRHI